MSKITMRGAALLLGFAARAATAAPDSPPETALADYVAAPDTSYEWRETARYDAAGAEIVELRLHSQTWRGTLWKHQLYLIRPDDVDADSGQGLLIIGGGRWRDAYDDPAVAPALPEDAGVYIGVAQQLRSVTAVIAQVPFQPLFGLREDELIAHTFDRYLETGDAEWPLLLPMVKSAVRAMDAAEAFAADEWNVDLERFTVTGGSKRGWTTWLTGAVDERAAALAPVVIDAVRFEAHMPHQRAAWGELSDELAPYTRRGLHEVFSSAAGRSLRRIVDPYSYLDRLTQPKLVVVATNDRYFPVDALNLYWDALRPPKHVLYLPNNGHSIEDFGRFVPALRALHRHSAGGEPLPSLEWEFLPSPAGGLRLCVRGNPSPASVTTWSADSDDTDFRDDVFAAETIPAAVAAIASAGAEPTTHVIDVAAPESGFRAVFAEALLGQDDERYLLSTNLRVIDASGRPPFPDTAVDGSAGVCADARGRSNGTTAPER